MVGSPAVPVPDGGAAAEILIHAGASEFTETRGCFHQTGRINIDLSRQLQPGIGTKVVAFNAFLRQRVRILRRKLAIMYAPCRQMRGSPVLRSRSSNAEPTFICFSFMKRLPCLFTIMGYGRNSPPPAAR